MSPVELLERAVDEYYAEYQRNYPQGGDEGDHQEAVRCAVEAVVVLVLRAAREEQPA